MVRICWCWSSCIRLSMFNKQSHHVYSSICDALEKTEGATTNGQSRDTGNIGHTRHNTKTNKTKHNTEN
jgi:hypothetical protein